MTQSSPFWLTRLVKCAMCIELKQTARIRNIHTLRVNIANARSLFELGLKAITL